LNTIGYRFSIALDAVYGASSTKKCVSDLGVSQSTIDRGKRGDSLTKTISLFAAKNNISTSWILTGSGEMMTDERSINQVITGNSNNQAGRNVHSGANASSDPIVAAIESLLGELDANEKLQVLSYITSLKVKN